MECDPLLANDQYAKQHKTEVRRNFIRKVLGIVSAQVIVSVAAVYMFMQSNLAYVDLNGSMTDFYSSRTFSILIVSFVIYLAIAITIFCCKKVARTVPTNYILLFLLTICISYMLAVICQFYTTASIFNALLITILVTCGLTGFTIVYKPKLSIIIGAIVVVFLGLVGILILYLVLLFSGGNVQGVLFLYYFLGVILYGLFLVFDVKRLTSKKYGLTIDDYVFAALMIYLDIVNLFLEILRLVGDKK